MHAPNGGPRSASIRIIAVTAGLCGFLLASGPIPAAAADRPDEELAQPARKRHHARPPARKAEERPAPSAAPGPRAQPPGAAPESRPAEPEDKGEEEEEVSPGDDPASCDGCELAGSILAGTLWGLFGVSRRRGIPRPVVRGLQLRR